MVGWLYFRWTNQSGCQDCPPIKLKLLAEDSVALSKIKFQPAQFQATQTELTSVNWPGQNKLCIPDLNWKWKFLATVFGVYAIGNIISLCYKQCLYVVGTSCFLFAMRPFWLKTVILWMCFVFLSWDKFCDPTVNSLPELRKCRPSKVCLIYTFWSSLSFTSSIQERLL